MSGLTLVTGATGFVGGFLVEALLAQPGARVRVLVRDAAGVPARWQRKVEIFVRDLARAEGPADGCRGVDTVLHLAGHAHAEDEGSDRSDALHQAITVEGTRRLLADATTHGARRLIFLSSVKAMGESTTVAADEATPPAPVTAYGRAKLAAEALVLGAGRPEGVVVRSPLVYGPGVRGNLHRMTSAIAAHRFPPLPRVANRRSMIDVRDLIAALLLVARDPAASGRVFVATDGETYSTRRLYEALCAALERPAGRWTVPLAILRAGGRVGDLVARATGKTMPITTERLAKLFGDAEYSNRALCALGFRPAFRLETALPEMMRAWHESDAP